MTTKATKTKYVPMKEGETIKQGPDVRRSRRIKGFGVLAESSVIGEFVKNSGQYVILPKGTRLMKGIRALIDKHVSEPLCFEEVVLPKIAPVSTFRKAGILGRWDEYLMSVKPFSDTKGVTDEYLMDPLQCTALYQLFENRSFDTSTLPIRWFDCSGPTYRNEDSDKIVQLVKQREFHRAEFTYLGTKAQAITVREECLARFEQLCNELGLQYRIVVGAGCYQIKEGELETFDSIDEIPIKDLEIFCPGYANQNGEQYLEVIGSSILGTILTSRFNITGNNGSELWSGCTGIGLERMMFALITNYGTDFEEFPETITKAMK